MDDLDYRPEALDVDDELRWLGKWYTITARRPASAGTVFDVVQSDDGTEKTLLFRPGCWIAARPADRAAAGETK